jgi:hypothetical protein
LMTMRTLTFRSMRRVSTRDMQYLCRVVLGRRWYATGTLSMRRPKPGRSFPTYIGQVMQNADATTLRTCKVDDIVLSILIIATPRDLGLSRL